MANDDSQNERRDFYRVNDNIALAYDIMPVDFSKDQVGHEAVDEHHLSSRILADLQAIDTETQTVLQNLPDRDVRACLTGIHQKIDLLARYVAALKPERQRRFESVNISGGGIQFPCDQTIENNRTVKLELLLYPSCATILCYANVVNCVKNENNSRYLVSAQYLNLPEKDRDTLIKHVLQAQASQIREEKTENER